MTTYTILNGPQMCQKVTALYGRTVRCYVFGEWLDYERAPSEIESRIGAALMVSGTSHAIADGSVGAVFAHPEHAPTMLDFRTMTLHPCEYDTTPAQAETKQ